MLFPLSNAYLKLALSVVMSAKLHNGNKAFSDDAVRIVACHIVRTRAQYALYEYDFKTGNLLHDSTKTLEQKRLLHL